MTNTTISWIRGPGQSGTESCLPRCQDCWACQRWPRQLWETRVSWRWSGSMDRSSSPGQTRRMTRWIFWECDEERYEHFALFLKSSFSPVVKTTSERKQSVHTLCKSPFAWGWKRTERAKWWTLNILWPNEDCDSLSSWQSPPKIYWFKYWNDQDTVKALKQLGVNGVIYDRMDWNNDKLIKESIFMTKERSVTIWRCKHFYFYGVWKNAYIYLVMDGHNRKQN